MVLPLRYRRWPSLVKYTSLPVKMLSRGKQSSLIHCCTSANEEEKVYVLAKYLQAKLMFAIKAIAYPIEAPFRSSLE
jgi:hypothetical protein